MFPVGLGEEKRMAIRTDRSTAWLIGLTTLLGCAPQRTPESDGPARADTAWEDAAGVPADGRQVPAPPVLYHANVRTVDDLLALTGAMRAERGEVMVPNVAPIRFPPDLDRLPVEARKRAFFRSLLPLVVHENTRVAAQRKRLLEVLDPGRTIPLTAEEDRFVRRLGVEYGVDVPEPMGRDDVLATLLLRVDVVPVPLALAQAAIESAWGTSRFAQDGNAIFGQWTLDPERPGLVPEGRPDGEAYRVEAFPHIHASIRGYMRNLNTHRAYREFRARRAAQRRLGRPLDAFALAETLDRYSARGDEYIAELVAVMRQNQLNRFARARLVPAGRDLVNRFVITTSDGGQPIALAID